VTLDEIKDDKYLAKFLQDNYTWKTRGIDYLLVDGEIIKHSWAMGGSSKTTVKSVPDNIEGYERVWVKN